MLSEKSILSLGWRVFPAIHITDTHVRQRVAKRVVEDDRVLCNDLI